MKRLSSQGVNSWRVYYDIWQFLDCFASEFFHVCQSCHYEARQVMLQASHCMTDQQADCCTAGTSHYMSGWWWWLFPHMQGSWGRFNDSFLNSAYFFFSQWISVHAHQFHFLGQGQSTVAQQANMTVANCSLASCMWALAVSLLGQHSLPTQTSLGQGCM